MGERTRTTSTVLGARMQPCSRQMVEGVVVVGVVAVVVEDVEDVEEDDELDDLLLLPVV